MFQILGNSVEGVFIIDSEGIIQLSTINNLVIGRIGV